MLFKLTKVHDRQANIVSFMAKCLLCSVSYKANSADSNTQAFRVVDMIA